MNGDVFRRHISGRSNTEIGERLFPERSVEEHVLLLDRKEALFRELADDLVPLPGAVELLDLARANEIGLALVTTRRAGTSSTCSPRLEQPITMARSCMATR